MALSKNISALLVCVLSGCTWGTQIPQGAIAQTNTAGRMPKSETVWIAKSDNAKQCEKSSGNSLQETAAALLKEEIKVLDQKKSHDNKMRILTCGADKGSLNTYLIDKRDLDKATKKMGFFVLNNHE